MENKWSDIQSNTDDFFEQCRIKQGPYGQFAFAPGKQPTYWASAYAALTKSLVNTLKELDQEKRKEWLVYLQEGQDEETGLFKEPVKEEDLKLPHLHTKKGVLWHSAMFVYGAIYVLGGLPKYPISIIEPYKDPKKMVEFLENLPWKDPWKVGNWTHDLGCMMGVDHEITKDQRNIEAMDAFFDWMDTHQDPKTGWWDPLNKQELHQMQFGGYHTLMVYWMFDRKERYPKEMIESSLQLQSPNGSYFDMGCCGDMDVVDTVVNLSQKYGILQQPVKESLQRFLPYLSQLYQNQGFIGKKGTHHTDYCWDLHTGEVDRPDPCSTYFRLFTLSLMDEMIPIEGLDVDWNHHHWYCHGVRPKACL